jgi:hypothetical protein
MSHRMKMNQHIITMASPPGDVKLFKRHCSGAFLAPQQAGGITGENACSRCCACKGLSSNGQRMHPNTAYPSDNGSKVTRLFNTFQ